MELSVVVPVFNEYGNIGPLLGEIGRALGADTDYEVIVVDDGSDDATGMELAGLQRHHPRLRVLRHGVNRGQSAAIATGVEAARAAWVVTLDGDGQNDPRDIRRLLWARDAAWGRRKADGLIVGLRRNRNDTLVRRLSSRIANAVRARLLRDGCPDTGCGLKLFPRDTFLQLPHFDHMHRFLPALFRSHGCEVIAVDVNHRPRLRGRSKYGVFDRLWVGIADLAGVMWLQRRACRTGHREPGR